MRNPSGPYEEVVPFDGKIERPTLTMHGTGDLFVPVFLEQSVQARRRRVRQRASAGAAALSDRWTLPVQPARNRFSAFDDLVKVGEDRRQAGG